MQRSFTVIVCLCTALAFTGAAALANTQKFQTSTTAQAHNDEVSKLSGFDGQISSPKAACKLRTLTLSLSGNGIVPQKWEIESEKSGKWDTGLQTYPAGTYNLTVKVEPLVLVRNPKHRKVCKAATESTKVTLVGV